MKMICFFLPFILSPILKKKKKSFTLIREYSISVNPNPVVTAHYEDESFRPVLTVDIISKGSAPFSLLFFFFLLLWKRQLGSCDQVSTAGLTAAGREKKASKLFSLYLT